MATYHPVIPVTGGQEAKKTMRMALTVASAVGLVALSVHAPALAPNRRHMLRAAPLKLRGRLERGREGGETLMEGERGKRE